MAARCRVCGAWKVNVDDDPSPDMWPAAEARVALFPYLKTLHEIAAEYDRGSERIVSGEMDLTTAAAFIEWVDFEVRAAAGVTNGRTLGAGSAGSAGRALGLDPKVPA